MSTFKETSMIEKSQPGFRGPAAYALIFGIELAVYALFLLLLLDPGGTLLVIDLVIAAGLVAFFRFKRPLGQRLSATFGAHRVAVRVGGIVLLLLMPFFLVTNAYWLLNIITAGLFIIACFGLNLQLGSTGMMNLAGAAFYAFGAYSAGLLALQLKLPPWLTIPAGALITGIFSVFLFIPVLRTKGHYLALVTIAFQFMVVIGVENMEWTGGPQGLKNIPLFSVGGYSFNSPINLGFVTLPNYANFYYLMLAIVFVLVIVMDRLYNSWVGNTLSNIRDDEVAARTSGVISNRWKMIMFVLGNSFIGLAGAFYAHMIGFISPPVFGFDKSLLMVSIVILGGMDNLLGIVVGAVLLIIMPEKLRFIQDYRFLIYGLVLILMLIFRPQGLLPFKLRDYLGLTRAARAAKPAVEKP
jgi:branched-chain amino acid transport system permease protein